MRQHRASRAATAQPRLWFARNSATRGNSGQSTPPCRLFVPNPVSGVHRRNLAELCFPGIDYGEPEIPNRCIKAPNIVAATTPVARDRASALSLAPCAVPISLRPGLSAPVASSFSCCWLPPFCYSCAAFLKPRIVTPEAKRRPQSRLSDCGVPLGPQRQALS